MKHVQNYTHFPWRFFLQFLTKMSHVLKIGVHLTPIDPLFYNYINIIPPDAKNAQEILHGMEKTINNVNDFFQQCVSESDKHRNKLFTFNPTDLTGLRPQVRFATRKMEKLQKRLVEFSESFFINMAKKISRLAHFLAESLSNNCPVEVDILGLRHFVRTSHDTDPLNVKYRKRISILDNYANRLSKAPIIPDIPNEQIIAVSREVSSKVDPVTLHSVPSVLDDFVFIYISSHKGVREFDELVQKVSLNPKFINMQPFQPFINKFVARFGVLEKNETNVLRVAISRFFFERFFKTNSKLYIEQPESDKFLKNCHTMSQMSPKELFINKKFIRDCDFEKSFSDIVRDNKELQNALDNIILATFYTFPADILQSVYSAMKNTEDYVKIASLEREFGSIESIDWNSESAIHASSDLAFDDFFPIFSAVFSVGPMANALAIQHLLEMIEKLVIPTTFDFAKVVFMTTVSHIMHFNPEEYVKSFLHQEEEEKKEKERNQKLIEERIEKEKEENQKLNEEKMEKEKEGTASAEEEKEKHE